MSLFELTEEQTHEVEPGLRVGEVERVIYSVTVMRSVEDGVNTTAVDVSFDADYPSGSAQVWKGGHYHDIPLSRLPVCRRREDVARWAVVAALKREQDADSQG